MGRSVDRCAAAFEGLLASRRGEPAWMTAARRSSFDTFSRQGFPTREAEAWRFTDLSAVEQVVWAAARADAPVDTARIAALSLPGEVCRLVFVDGRYRKDLSMPGIPGIDARPIGEVLRSEPGVLEGRLGRHAKPDANPFVALNAALWDDGAWVHIRRGFLPAGPLHLVFWSTGQAGTTWSVRNIVVAGPGAEATVIETHAGDGGPTFANVVTEAVAQDGARLDHVKMGRESGEALHIATVQARVERSARVRQSSVVFGGRLVRNDVNVVLGAEGASCRLDGLYHVDGRRIVDHHTFIDHASPHASSEELYKGILSGHGTGVFHGRIRVRKDAQKTDARQTNRNLLLSRSAVIETNPQLEILADDVKCSHGATIGQIDPTAMFYLRSRGIAEPSARRMLVRAFASEMLERLPEVVRPWLASEMDARLADGGPGGEAA